jgi:iron complex transport system ATP-binding protein
MTAIELFEISFAFDGRPVLDEICLSIAAGERTAVIGPNGVGKTTLLRLISGVLTPGKGLVRLDGHPLPNIARRELARKIAVVPQEFAVPFAFTARELVELGRTPHLHFWAGPRRADRHAVSRAMELTDTIPFGGRTFNELSGGERQRLMIAMALAQEPEILLLDEPTQQLDITRQAEILDLVCELNSSQRLTAVAAIHDLNLAARYFKRLIVLHGGSVLADGPPSDVLSRDLLQEAYEGLVDVSPSKSDHLPVILPVPRSRSSHREQ